MTQIVITGMGVISPYGVGPAPLWDNLLAGNSALTELTNFDTSHIQCRVGGQLKDFESKAYVSPRLTREIDRFSTLGVVAALLALRDAGLLNEKDTPLWRDEGQTLGRGG